VGPCCGPRIDNLTRLLRSYNIPPRFKHFKYSVDRYAILKLAAIIAFCCCSLGPDHEAITSKTRPKFVRDWSAHYVDSFGALLKLAAITIVYRSSLSHDHEPLTTKPIRDWSTHHVESFDARPKLAALLKLAAIIVVYCRPSLLPWS
jgi:hypothetical protein